MRVLKGHLAPSIESSWYYTLSVTLGPEAVKGALNAEIHASLYERKYTF